MRSAIWLVLGAGGALVGCGEGLDAPIAPVGPVPAYDQRAGDPANGYRALLDEGYVGCGIPMEAYRKVFPGPAPASERLPGRTGTNAELPYNFTAFTTASGVEVVTPNCLQCHAERLDGELVIGLGSQSADYTDDIGNYAELIGSLVDSEAARAEWSKWRDRIVTVAPYTVTETIGVNPADNLAAILFSHRDPDTLEWSEEPRLEYPPNIVVPVDVPPWWHMQKKNAMFYVGAGRGDHARIMMTASTLCVDSVEEAEAIDAYFPDVRSYLLTLEPPAWPYATDPALVETGRVIFEQICASCHGTYGEAEQYPNLIVAIEDVGTDSTMTLGAGQFADRFLDWYNKSFFGELSFLSPAPGYVAPPLDGIWATAPFLHNGSVPTLAALLESPTRPTYFTRSYDSSDYDPIAVGWNFTPLANGQDTDQDVDRVEIYDTTLLGYGNGGHTFGDALTAGERSALLEYLKTL
jgi:mono/diheme cytochrome c family protein